MEAGAGDGKDGDKMIRRWTTELLVRSRDGHSREEKQGNKGKNASAELNVVPTFNSMQSMAIQSHEIVNKGHRKAGRNAILMLLVEQRSALKGIVSFDDVADGM